MREERFLAFMAHFQEGSPRQSIEGHLMFVFQFDIFREMKGKH
jgi:hypothetical protein